MEIIISNKITVIDPPSDLTRELKSRLSFPNPKFLENDRLGYSNWNVPRILKYYAELDNGDITAPRGYMRQLIGLCRREDVLFHIEDNRRTLDSVNLAFNGTLRPFQEIACKDILFYDFGVLPAPTGSGKTIMCLYCIAERKQPALIVVHTKELLNQWIDRIERFLGIPANEVGIIGNGKKQIGEKITVALVQSLYKYAEEVSKSIGFLICDEAHRCPSRMFTQAVSSFDARFMLGLSATMFRRDQLTRLIFWYLGDQVHEIKAEDLVEKGHILKAEVISRETNYTTCLDASEEYSKMLSELTMDPE